MKVAVTVSRLGPSFHSLDPTWLKRTKSTRFLRSIHNWVSAAMLSRCIQASQCFLSGAFADIGLMFMRTCLLHPTHISVAKGGKPDFHVNHPAPGGCGRALLVPWTIEPAIAGLMRSCSRPEATALNTEVLLSIVHDHSREQSSKSSGGSSKL